MKKDRGRDVVRDVAYEREVTPCEQRQVSLEDIALHDIEPRICRISFAKLRGQRAIDLDRDHATGALEELMRKPAATRPNLDYGLVRARGKRVGDACEDARIAEKVLTEALPYRRKGTAIALPWRAHSRIRSVRMRLPWQPKQPPLALRIARTLERRGVGIQGLAVETHRGRATLRGVVTSDVVHDRAIEIARSVEGVESIDDLLSVIDPETVRPRRMLRHEDCTAVYITRPGDTLPGIAERLLGERGRWRELRDANSGIVGNGPLAPGLRLKIRQ